MPLHKDYQIETSTGGRRFWVKGGHLIDADSGEVIPAISGALDGFRVDRKKTFDGHALTIRLSDGADTYIISGDLEAFGRIQTWARMALGRLGHPSRPVKQGDRIRIEIRPWEGPKGTASLCYISPEDDMADLEEARIEDQRDLLAALERIADAAPWSSGKASLPAASDLPALGEGKPAKATAPANAEDAQIVPDDDDLPF